MLTAYDATVRDITASGARIRAGEYTRLPEAFELQVRDEKYPRMARVAWRSGADAGLVFTRTDSARMAGGLSALAAEAEKKTAAEVTAAVVLLQPFPA